MRLTRNELGAWVQGITAGAPPPTLRVLHDGRDVLETLFPGLQELPTHGRHDPGCYRFFLPAPNPKNSSDYVDLRAIASQIYSAGLEYGRAIGIELDASIDPDLLGSDSPFGNAFGETFGLSPNIDPGVGNAVPSVGPGGYVALGRRAGVTVIGTSSIRPFVADTQTSLWLDVDSVFAAVAGLLDVGLEFEPSFGYYERTWMEHQEFIEPVHALLVEDDSQDYPMKRQITIPATMTP